MKFIRLLGSLGAWLGSGLFIFFLIIGGIATVKLLFPEADTTLVAFIVGSVLGLLKALFCRG